MEEKATETSVEDTTRAENEIVEKLIKRHGDPRTVVHKTYQYGSEHTHGVLSQGCCNACANEGKIEEGHFACTSLPDDLDEAEKKGLVYRTFEGNQWWVVLDQRFCNYYKIDEEAIRGERER